jgi:hypothetical protein
MTFDMFLQFQRHRTSAVDDSDTGFLHRFVRFGRFVVSADKYFFRFDVGDIFVRFNPLLSILVKND